MIGTDHVEGKMLVVEGLFTTELTAGERNSHTSGDGILLCVVDGCELLILMSLRVLGTEC